jgi:hypothetical protein
MRGLAEERFEKQPCIPSGSNMFVHVCGGSGIALHCAGDDSLKKTPEAAHQMGVENFIGEQVLTNARSLNVEAASRGEQGSEGCPWLLWAYNKREWPCKKARVLSGTQVWSEGTSARPAGRTDYPAKASQIPSAADMPYPLE